jgi:hypothetical protein
MDRRQGGSCYFTVLWDNICLLHSFDVADVVVVVVVVTIVLLGDV